jgi:heptosyltransferase III
MPRLLFITSNRIGDAVLSTAALQALCARMPGAGVIVACGPLARDLFRAWPNLEALETFDKSSGRWSGLRARLAGRRYDLAVDLRGSLITYFLRCGRRIIYRKRPGPTVHKVEELARLIGVEAGPTVLPRDAKAEADAAAIFASRDFLALGPGANWIGKTWPAAAFAQAARALSAPGAAFEGAPIVLLGGPGEEAIAAQVAQGLAGVQVINAVGKLDLLATAALVARARLYIGNDSGLMHIAAATGVRTLGLFGPSPETIYGPWGDKTQSIRGPRDYHTIWTSEDMYAVKRSLMEDLTVPAVVAAAEGLLQR